MAMRRSILILSVIFLLCPAVFAQEEPPVPEDPPEKTDTEQESSAATGEEARQSLIRRIKARKLIKDLEDPQKRQAALPQLDELGAEAIEEMLKVPEAHVRESLLALCRTWTAGLSSEKFDVRDRAFRLLYVAGDTVVDMLGEAANSVDRHLSETAGLLLHMIDHRISPELYERLGHVMAGFEKAEWRTRMDMIAELERLGGPLAVPPLKRILTREQNPRVQAQAANSLIRVGTVADLLFLKQIGLAQKIQAPAITAEIYLSQGIKYMEAERYEEAIEEFKRALKDSPDDLRTHYEIAMAYLLCGKYALSVAHFRECLKKEPDNPIAHYNLACAYSLMNDADNAIKHLALSIEKGYKDLAHMEKDEDLDNIRTDPRYEELRKRFASPDNPPKEPESDE